ncbi:MAG TPA: hypothetical protein VJ352_06090, partial [Geodermatophilus sp.]|nr:hypothetical protein [Geodermatophilus sp.]
HGGDEPVDGHHLAAGHEQRGEQGAGAVAADGERTVAVLDRERPEDPEPHVRRTCHRCLACADRTGRGRP